MEILKQAKFIVEEIEEKSGVWLGEPPDTAEGLIEQVFQIWEEVDEDGVEICPCCRCNIECEANGLAGNHDSWCWFLRASRFLKSRPKD